MWFKNLIYYFFESFMGRDFATFIYAMIFGEYPKIEIPNFEVITMKPIDGGDHFTLWEFVEMCREASVIDQDGLGYYATELQVSNLRAYPSEIAKGNIKKSFTHVVWYNQ